jgi:hypothetical protein
LETSADQSLIYINNSVIDKDVHNWEPSGNQELDRLTTVYQEKYADLVIKDDFVQVNNFQRFNSNPWQSLYTDAALHFTNSSFQYSLMVDENNQPYIWPGPDVDEKVFKCLLAGIPFIPTGQFQTYKTLLKFGLQFDYKFDLSWDNLPGNLDRFSHICKLIDQLQAYSINDIVDATSESTCYNKEFIVKGGFYDQVEKFKIESTDVLLSILNS